MWKFVVITRDAYIRYNIYLTRSQLLRRTLFVMTTPIPPKLPAIQSDYLHAKLTRGMPIG